MVSFTTSILTAAAALSLAQAAPAPASQAMPATGDDGHHWHHHHHHNCSADQTKVEGLHASVHFPVGAQAVYNLVGDFFNTTWMPNVHITAQSGTDNTKGATRTVSGNQFAKQDELAVYKFNSTDYHLFQGMKAAVPVVLDASSSPAYTAESYWSMIAVHPECNGTVTKFVMKSSFCTTGTPSTSMDLETLAFQQASSTMNNMWTQQLAITNTAFNTTPACVALEPKHWWDHASN